MTLPGRAVRRRRERANPFLASLAQAKCAIILAAGDIPVAAVDQSASTFPTARFITVGGTHSTPNVSRISNDSSIEIETAISEAVGSVAPAR